MSQNLSILTHNVWCHYPMSYMPWTQADNLMDGALCKERLALLAKHCKDVDYDVVCLQELFVARFVSELKHNVLYMMNIMKENGYAFQSDPFESLHRFGQNSGLMIFSKHPLTKIDSVDFVSSQEKSNTKGFVAANVKINNQTNVFLITTHFDARSLDMKRRQIAQISTYIKTHQKDRPTIVCGDFNLCPQTLNEGGYDDGSGYNYLETSFEELGLRNATHGIYNPTHGRVTLDHFFYSKIKIVDTSVVSIINDMKLKISDHDGLKIIFLLDHNKEKNMLWQSEKLAQELVKYKGWKDYLPGGGKFSEIPSQAQKVYSLFSQGFGLNMSPYKDITQETNDFINIENIFLSHPVLGNAGAREGSTLKTRERGKRGLLYLQNNVSGNEFNWDFRNCDSFFSKKDDGSYDPVLVIKVTPPHEDHKKWLKKFRKTCGVKPPCEASAKDVDDFLKVECSSVNCKLKKPFYLVLSGQGRIVAARLANQEFKRKNPNFQLKIGVVIADVNVTQGANFCALKNYYVRTQEFANDPIHAIDNFPVTEIPLTCKYTGVPSREDIIEWMMLENMSAFSISGRVSPNTLQ